MRFSLRALPVIKGRRIRREGREKGCDFGRPSFIPVYSSAQPVARFACFTIYTLVSRTDDKRFPPSRRKEGGKKNLRYSRGMRGGIGVMDHDLTRSESG